MNFSEIVGRVISLAGAVEAYWDEELPKRHPDYPLVRPGDEDGPPPPEEQELKDLFAGLPDEAVYKIALVMYLGRGDFGADDLAGGEKVLQGRFDGPEDAVSQMMGGPLAAYLADGLADLDKASIDVDSLMSAPVGSGR